MEGAQPVHQKGSQGCRGSQYPGEKTNQSLFSSSLSRWQQPHCSRHPWLHSSDWALLCSWRISARSASQQGFLPCCWVPLERALRWWHLAEPLEHSWRILFSAGTLLTLQPLRITSSLDSPCTWRNSQSFPQTPGTRQSVLTRPRQLRLSRIGGSCYSSFAMTTFFILGWSTVQLWRKIVEDWPSYKRTVTRMTKIRASTRTKSKTSKQTTSLCSSQDDSAAASWRTFEGKLPGFSQTSRMASILRPFRPSCTSTWPPSPRRSPLAAFLVKSQMAYRFRFQGEKLRSTSIDREWWSLSWVTW